MSSGPPGAPSEEQSSASKEPLRVNLAKDVAHAVTPPDADLTAVTVDIAKTDLSPALSPGDSDTVLRVDIGKPALATPPRWVAIQEDVEPPRPPRTASPVAGSPHAAADDPSSPPGSATTAGTSDSIGTSATTDARSPRPTSAKPRDRQVLLFLVAAGAALWLLLGGAWLFLRPSNETTPLASVRTTDPSRAPESDAAPAPQPSNTTATSGAIASPTTTQARADFRTAIIDPAEFSEQEAWNALSELRDDSVARTSLDGRFVLQLASKWSGISDPAQSTPSGSHTFENADILWEHTVIRDKLSSDYPVILLLAGDFGDRRSEHDGDMFVTLADFTGPDTREGAEAACARLFPNLAGEALRNVCLPRRLKPPA